MDRVRQLIICRERDEDMVETMNKVYIDSSRSLTESTLNRLDRSDLPRIWIYDGDRIVGWVRKTDIPGFRFGPSKRYSQRFYYETAFLPSTPYRRRYFEKKNKHPNKKTAVSHINDLISTWDEQRDNA